MGNLFYPLRNPPMTRPSEKINPKGKGLGYFSNPFVLLTVNLQTTYNMLQLPIRPFGLDA